MEIFSELSILRILTRLSLGEHGLGFKKKKKININITSNINYVT